MYIYSEYEKLYFMLIKGSLGSLWFLLRADVINCSAELSVYRCSY